MKTGTVKWFNDSRGFGYITPTGGGDDIFFHRSAVMPEQLIAVIDGINVTFETNHHDPEGPSAINVITR